MPAWLRARDVLAGEDAVKTAGEKYLPRLDSQSDEEYEVYKARASFFGATARTLEEYLELIFRRAPLTSVFTAESLRAFLCDCGLWGTDFTQYARRVVSKVLAVGRAASLVSWEQDGRPVVSLRKAEEIVDWSVSRVGERLALSAVTLVEGERRRVLRLDETNETDGTNGPRCVVELWRPSDERDGAEATAGRDVPRFGRFDRIRSSDFSWGCCWRIMDG